jgi:hypothetical protein
LVHGHRMTIQRLYDSIALPAQSLEELGPVASTDIEAQIAAEEPSDIPTLAPCLGSAWRRSPTHRWGR